MTVRVGDYLVTMVSLLELPSYLKLAAILTHPPMAHTH
jgi:hypothetical protein